MYKISLIIVLENSEKSIKKLFESIKEQSIGFKNIELICLYNTLNNNILKYIKKLEQKNCNVKLFNIKTDNIGKMFNFGINKSTTNYLMFLRDNVSIYNETCEYLYNLVSNNNVDFVSGNSLNIINSTVKKSKWSDFELDNIIETSSSNIHENIFLLPSNLSSKMYNKKFLTLNHIMFNEEKLLLDLIFVYQTLLCSNKTIYVNQTLSKNIVNINYNKQILIDMVDSYYFLTKVFDEYNKNIRGCLIFI